MKRDLTESVETTIANSTAVKKALAPVDGLLNRMFQQTALRPIKLLMNGSWLGHPLHPLLKDVPMGAWIFTVLFDVVGLAFNLPQLGVASSIADGVGVAGALAAAAAGLMDWMDTDPAEKSVGFVHGITNTIATLIFLASFVIRWRDRWELSWTSFGLGAIGLAIVSAGAYLGGGLVYRMGVMINRNAYRNGPADFKAALPVSDLVEGKMRRVEVDGQPILLVKTSGKIYALGAVCSHYGAPLEEGKLEDGCVQCPWHFSRFALEDGSIKEGPTCSAVPSYDVRTANDQIEIRFRS